MRNKIFRAFLLLLAAFIVALSFGCAGQGGQNSGGQTVDHGPTVEPFDPGDYAVVVYVSPDGDDQSLGIREDSPVRTLERAQEIARARAAAAGGDVAVVLRQGTYFPSRTLTFDERDSGKNGNKVVWTNYPGERAVVSGGRRVTGWTPVQDGVYVADLDLPYVRNLYVNGERQTLARTPNVGAWLQMAYWDTDNAEVQIYADEAEVSPGDELGIACSWAMRYFRVKNVREEDGVVKIGFEEEETQLFFGEYELGRSWPIMDNNEMFFVQNGRAHLDAKGEFYFDKQAGKLYYIPKENVDMETAEIWVPELEGLLRIRGSATNRRVENLVFNGIVFEYAGFTAAERTGFIDLQAALYAVESTEQILKYDVPTGTVHIENAENIGIQNCVIRHAGGNGINVYLSASEISLTGNQITDISASGIQIAPYVSAKTDGKDLYRPYSPGEPNNYEVHGVDVVNNVVSWIGMEYHGGVGIGNAVGYDIRILHNEIGFTHYTGITNGWGWSTIEYVMKDITIAYNDVHHNMMTMEDGGCFYNLNNIPNLQVRGNYFHDILRNRYASKSAPCYAIYLDEGTSNVFVTENVIAAANENEREMSMLFHNVGFGNYTLNNYHEDASEASAIIENAGVTSQYSNMSLKNHSAWGNSALTHVRMGQPENGMDGEVGFKFTLNRQVNVTALGRFWSYGNVQRHRVTIYDLNGREKLSAVVDMSKGYPDYNGFKYVRLNGSYVLSAGTYYIVSEEFSGGDLWLGNTSIVVSSPDFRVEGHVRIENGELKEGTSGSESFAAGVVNFLYE